MTSVCATWLATKVYRVVHSDSWMGGLISPLTEGPNRGKSWGRGHKRLICDRNQSYVKKRKKGFDKIFIKDNPQHNAICYYQPS